MRPSDSAAGAGVILERFDYARVGDHLAVVRVQAVLAGAGAAPESAELSVRDGQSPRLRFPLRTGRLERRLRTGGDENVWTALFALPSAFTGRSGIVFELSAGDMEPIVLPFPMQRPAEPRGLELVAAADSAVRSPHSVRQAVALATVAAVTASSMPASALADAAVSAAKTTPKARQLASLQRTVHRQQRQPQVSLSTHAATVPTARPAHTASGAKTAPRAATHRSPAPPESGLAVRYRSVSQHPHPKPVPPATAPAKGPSTTPSGTTPAGTTPAGTTPTGTTPAGTTPTGTTPTGTTPTSTTPTGTTTPGPTPPPPSSTGSSGGVAAGTGDTTTPAPVPTTPAPVPTPAPQPPSTSPIPKQVKPEPRTHGHKRVRAHHEGSGGAAVRPLGSLTDKPPVRLSSAPSSSSTLSSTPAGFSGPTSWTGTVSNDPALVTALGNLSAVLADADHPPRFLIPIYMEAGRRYHVPWEVLAAINSVESNYGRNLNTSTAGAIGWMQFEPSTWQRYGLAVDGHSVPNPYDPRDAIFSAARYLAAAGASQDLWGAVYAYNHASWYVDMVLSRARSIAAAVRPERQINSKRGVISVFFSALHTQAQHHRHRVVRYRGGPLSHYVRLIASANMVSAANFPYVWGGGHEQPARFGPFDCSGSVSYVMQQAGYKVPTSVSGNIGSWKFPSGPGRVTIFYNPTHTFMRIGNRYFGTSGFARPGGGAGWFSTNQLPVGYLDQFQEVHVPQLGSNSFAAPRHRAHSRTATARRVAPVVAPVPSFSPGLLRSLRP